MVPAAMRSTAMSALALRERICFIQFRVSRHPEVLGATAPSLEG